MAAKFNTYKNQDGASITCMLCCDLCCRWIATAAVQIDPGMSLISGAVRARATAKKYAAEVGGKYHEATGLVGCAACWKPVAAQPATTEG